MPYLLKIYRLEEFFEKQFEKAICSVAPPRDPISRNDLKWPFQHEIIFFLQNTLIEEDEVQTQNFQFRRTISQPMVVI